MKLIVAFNLFVTTTQLDHFTSQKCCPRRKPSIVDESHRDGAKQESFSEHERFMRMKKTTTLRKNGNQWFGQQVICCGQAGWQMKILLFKKFSNHVT